MNWNPHSWKNHRILQPITYRDPKLLQQRLDEIQQSVPLVYPGEVERLLSFLADAQDGRRFILQAGDCAERFLDCNIHEISDKLKIILQMSLVLFYGIRKPIVRIGRIAGQYAKPRTSEFETVNGITLPSYRGDNVNGFEFTAEAREPDPNRLIAAYRHSCQTLNWLRALNDGGFADVRHPELWTLSHMRDEEQPKFYSDLLERVHEANNFLELLGEASSEFMRRVDLFTSHEALHLDYESALTRVLPNHQPYNLGAHFLWLGERTRALDGAHVEYLRGIANPLGIKVGPSADPEEIVNLTEQLNPQRVKGKITIITRLGAGIAQRKIPQMVDAFRKRSIGVVWSCDPMHGNAVRTDFGIKTRSFDAIVTELRETIAAHASCDSALHGVHFELTGAPVTECIGGSAGISEDGLHVNYQTHCDPRLNYLQSLEMACLLADLQS